MMRPVITKSGPISLAIRIDVSTSGTLSDEQMPQ